VTLAYIDTRPFILILGLITLLVGVVLFRVVARRNIGPRGAALILGAWGILFGLAAYGPFVGYTRRVIHPMNWRVAPRSDPSMKGTHVILSFANYPGYEFGLYSDEVAAYLRGRTNQPVEMEFEVTYDYGSVRSFREMRIGALTNWQSGSSYFGASGDPSQSPFR